MASTILFVTGNEKKFADAVGTFEGSVPFTLVQQPYDLEEIQSDSQEEIAVRKARYAWEHFRAPLLIDEAGLFFKQYHNFPGTFSTYVYDSLREEGLYKLFKPGDPAYFRVVFAFADADGQVTCFSGSLDGTMRYVDGSLDPKFPFSDIFIPNGSTLSYQELAERGEKGPYSVRGQALGKFAAWYREKYA
jgi:XTP/dITP diphosphohydrolase